MVSTPQNISLPRLHLAILVLIFLIASVIGIRGLNMDSFWLDEYWSLHHAGGAFLGPRTLFDVWNGIASEDPWQAPLYYMMLNQWGQWVGWSELATRAMSLFFGLISIAGTYRLGRDLFSLRVGLAAAIFIGLSAYALYFFHELRAYTLYIVFTPFMVTAYWHLITRKERLKWYLLLGGMIIGALYTHYFAALTCIALGTFHLLSLPFGVFKQRSRIWWRITGVFVLSLIAFAPWLNVLVAGILTAVSQIGVRGNGALSTESAIEGLLYLFSNGSTLVLVMLLLFALSSRKRNIIFVWFWALLVLVILLAINVKLGVLLEIRYMLALWPALAILAGIGADYLYQRQPIWALLLVGLWGISGIWVSLDINASRALSNPHWHLPWRELRADLLSRAVGGDEVVMLLPDWTWAVYHGDTKEYYMHDLSVNSVLMEQPGHIGFERYSTEARDAISATSRVWLASDPTQPLTHHTNFLNILAEYNYQHCATVQNDDQLTLDLFARLPSERQTIRFGTQPFVDVSLQTPQPDQSNQTLSLSPFFVTDDSAWASRYSIAFHLSTTTQPIVAQVDYGVPSQAASCGLIELNLDRVSTGNYDLLVTVYAWETGERLAVSNSGSLPVLEDGRVQIGTINVVRSES